MPIIQHDATLKVNLMLTYPAAAVGSHAQANHDANPIENQLSWLFGECLAIPRCTVESPNRALIESITESTSLCR